MVLSKYDLYAVGIVGIAVTGIAAYIYLNRTAITAAVSTAVNNNPVTNAARNLVLNTGIAMESGNTAYLTAPVINAPTTAQVQAALSGVQSTIFVNENSNGVPTSVGTYGGAVSVPTTGNGSTSSPFNYMQGWQGIGYYTIPNSSYTQLFTLQNNFNSWYNALPSTDK